MADGNTDAARLVVIQDQQLHGSRQEMLASIDQAITGLLALRHLIAAAPVVAGAGTQARGTSLARGRQRTPFTMVGWLFSKMVHSRRRDHRN